MISVHPAFDPATHTWFTSAPEPVAEAPTLRVLQAQLGAGVHIVGYHPRGFRVSAETRGFSMATIEREWREGDRALRLELRRVTIRARKGRPPKVLDAAAAEAAIERRRVYMRDYHRMRRTKLKAAEAAVV